MRPTCESQRAFSTLSFHSSADHRYLHSFPTRRSSDLAGYYPGGETLHIKILYHSETNKLLGGQIIGKKGVDKRIEDRKSTRLNSSHVAISYAVFCLKKKAEPGAEPACHHVARVSARHV